MMGHWKNREKKRLSRKKEVKKHGRGLMRDYRSAIAKKAKEKE